MPVRAELLDAVVADIGDVEGAVRGERDRPLVVAAPADRREVDLPFAGTGCAPRLEEAAVRGKDLEAVVVAVRHPDGAVRGDSQVRGIAKRKVRIAAAFPEELDRAGGRRGGGRGGLGGGADTAGVQGQAKRSGPKPASAVRRETTDGARVRSLFMTAGSSVRNDWPAVGSTLLPTGRLMWMVSPSGWRKVE